MRTQFSGPSDSATAPGQRSHVQEESFASAGPPPPLSGPVHSFGGDRPGPGSTGTNTPASDQEPASAAGLPESDPVVASLELTNLLSGSVAAPSPRSGPERATSTVVLLQPSAATTAQSAAPHDPNRSLVPKRIPSKANPIVASTRVILAPF
jgi:hypothetical protein